MRWGQWIDWSCVGRTDVHWAQLMKVLKSIGSFLPMTGVWADIWWFQRICIGTCWLVTNPVQVRSSLLAEEWFAHGELLLVWHQAHQRSWWLIHEARYQDAVQQPHRSPRPNQFLPSVPAGFALQWKLLLRQLLSWVPPHGTPLVYDHWMVCESSNNRPGRFGFRNLAGRFNEKHSYVLGFAGFLKCVLKRKSGLLYSLLEASWPFWWFLPSVIQVPSCALVSVSESQHNGIEYRFEPFISINSPASNFEQVGIDHGLNSDSSRLDLNNKSQYLSGWSINRKAADVTFMSSRQQIHSRSQWMYLNHKHN